MTDRAGQAELLAQIYAAPDDDGPRLVYADCLHERGANLSGSSSSARTRTLARKQIDATLEKAAR